MAPVFPELEDPMRNKSAKLLYVALKGGDDVDKDEETALANLASRVESEIHRTHGKVEQVYKDAIRSKVYNLKDKHNPLRVRVISGVIAPQDFARMTPMEMASEEHQKMLADLRESTLQNSRAVEYIEPIVRDDSEEGITSIGARAANLLWSGGDADARI